MKKFSEIKAKAYRVIKFNNHRITWQSWVKQSEEKKADRANVKSLFDQYIIGLIKFQYDTVDRIKYLGLDWGEPAAAWVKKLYGSEEMSFGFMFESIVAEAKSRFNFVISICPKVMRKSLKSSFNRYLNKFEKDILKAQDEYEYWEKYKDKDPEEWEKRY